MLDSLGCFCDVVGIFLGEGFIFGVFCYFDWLWYGVVGCVCW